MRIEQFEYVLTVARYGSLSKAAANIYIGQPTLSAAISSLEKELGKALFRRTRRGMVLTPLGEDLLPMMEKAIDDFYAIKKKAGLFAPANSHLHLAAANPCMGVVHTAVMRSQEIFPTVRYYVSQLRPAEVLQAVEQKRAAIGLSFAMDSEIARHRNYAKAQNLRLMPLYHDTLCLFARSDGRFSRIPCFNFPDFNAATPLAVPLYLLQPGNSNAQSPWSNLPALTGFDDRETLKRYVYEKDALGATTRLQSRQDECFRMGRFKALKLDQCSINMVHYMCYAKDLEVSDMEADIIQQIENYYDYLDL